MDNSRLKELIKRIDKETDSDKALALITQLNEIVLEEKKPVGVRRDPIGRR